MTNIQSNLAHDPEHLLVGYLITSPSDRTMIFENINESHLESKQLKILYTVLKENHTHKKDLDLHLLINELEKKGQLEAAGGMTFVSDLTVIGGSWLDIEHYIEVIKKASLLKKQQLAVSKLSSALSLYKEDPTRFNDLFKEEFQKLEKEGSAATSTISMPDRLFDLHQMFKLNRGKKYIGLCQKTLPEFDDKLSGLRKLMLIAAQPNVGKTALTIQLSLDVLRNNPDACLVYFSLEMSSRDILTRMVCNLAQMDWKTLVFGSVLHDRAQDPDAYFSQDELIRTRKAEELLLSFGHRIQIFDMKELANLDSRVAISLINKVKEQTGCPRIIVVIDYLQVWPINANVRFTSEVEVDNWRIGEVKKIRDAINDDPLLVIAEARKPSGNEEAWVDTIAAVKGSSRGTYTPDIVMLFSPFSDKMFQKFLEPHLQKIPGNSPEDKIDTFRTFLAEQGKALCKINVDKVRDGMSRFVSILEFSFTKNTFISLPFSKLATYIKDVVDAIPLKKTLVYEAEPNSNSNQSSGYKNIELPWSKKK